MDLRLGLSLSHFSLVVNSLKFSSLEIKDVSVNLQFFGEVRRILEQLDIIFDALFEAKI